MAVKQEAADARHTSLELFEEKLRKRQERERRALEAQSVARRLALLADTAADSSAAMQVQASAEPGAVPDPPPPAGVRQRRNSAGSTRTGAGAQMGVGGLAGSGNVSEAPVHKDPRQPHEYVKPWRTHMADPAAGLGPLDGAKVRIFISQVLRCQYG